MDLERVKQLRNEYAEQHIVSKEQYGKINELLKGRPEQQMEESKRCREAVEVYNIKKDGMTRQERRAYQRMLAKQSKKTLTL